MRTTLAVAGLLVLPLAAPGLAQKPPGKPTAPPPCGTVLTESVRLAGTMTCPTGDALVAGADGIVLDLRGLTVQGPGAYAPNGGAGVRVPQRSDVTVVGGTVRDMSSGVVLDQAPRGHVSRVEVVRADRGIHLANAPDAVVEKNRVSQGGRDAILVSGPGSSDALVRQNEVVDNVFGIFVADLAADAVVTQNSVLRTSQPGLAVFAGASASFTRNSVADGGADGVQVSSSAAGATVAQNELARNAGDGLQSDLLGALVARNRAVDNGQLGIRAVPGTVDGGGNSASGNGDPQQCTGVECEPAG